MCNEKMCVGGLTMRGLLIRGWVMRNEIVSERVVCVRRGGSSHHLLQPIVLTEQTAFLVHSKVFFLLFDGIIAVGIACAHSCAGAGGCSCG